MSGNPPSVSVVMAVYNTERYLAESIESILKQSYADFELIIVDDGSTDNGWELISAYAMRDPRIRSIRRANCGVAAATNYGISVAVGQYIAIMDSDDISLPARLQVQKDFLDANENVAAVGSQYFIIDLDGNIVALDRNPIDALFVDIAMFSFMAVHNPTAMVRKDVFVELGGYNEDRSVLVHDYDFFLRVILAGFHLTNLNQVLFKWRLNPDGITVGKALAQTRSADQVRRSAFAQLLHARPEQACEVSRSILSVFPQGTWFDQKFVRLTGETPESYLIKGLKHCRTLDDRPALSGQDIQILEWFREENFVQPSMLDPTSGGSSNEWWQSLVRAKTREGLATVESTEIEFVALTIYPLSILVPYLGDADDLYQRVEEVLTFGLDVEILIFYVGKPGFLLDGARFSDYENVRIMPYSADSGEKSPWLYAFESAKGKYFAYLEQNIRFDQAGLRKFLSDCISENVDMVFIPSIQYFCDAIDDGGRPFADPVRQPRRTQETILGRSRVYLSGFVHKKELLSSLPFPIQWTVDGTAQALSLYFAHRSDFKILCYWHRHYVPPIQVENRIWHTFQSVLINWYFNSGYGALPSRSVWHQLRHDRITEIASSLNGRWQEGIFCVYKGNREDIIDFFIGYVHRPLRYALFRSLCRESNSYVVEGFRKQKRLFLSSICGLYGSVGVAKSLVRSRLWFQSANG